MIYEFNPFRISEELTPPQLRRPKMLAWLRVLFRPIQYVSDLFTRDFLKGANYDDYNNAITYSYGDRILWYNRSVYELRVTSSVGVKPTGDPLSLTNWMFIQKNYKGVDDILKYNSQRIVFEAAINDHFKITAPPYIYLYSGIATATQLSVYVPTTVWAAIGSNDDERFAAISEFVTRYIIADVSWGYVVY